MNICGQSTELQTVHMDASVPSSPRTIDMDSKSASFCAESCFPADLWNNVPMKGFETPNLTTGFDVRNQFCTELEIVSPEIDRTFSGNVGKLNSDTSQTTSARASPANRRVHNRSVGLWMAREALQLEMALHETGSLQEHDIAIGDGDAGNYFIARRSHNRAVGITVLVEEAFDPSFRTGDFESGEDDEDTDDDEEDVDWEAYKLYGSAC
eukprot:CAMPEP_0196743580 /NCGR_PEP_ID=MMETSP1091-20130531/53400_1 /TAXON_ID=302021 /ORGANISM="Rhodomonas sp., Strain CCMP768" /LENGTH=209 /DNA_ID=CAMNT_0042089963 /DNA_START=21 /DNA_END=650 /DNA_ORIENTATION=+